MNDDFDQLRLDNFKQVWRQYLIEEMLENLSPVVAMSPEDRDYVLRHHTTKAIGDKREVRLRADVDDLLHACSVLEIGFRVGVLADGEGRCERELGPILQLPELRAYSEERYPLSLPSALRLRIEANDLAPQSNFEFGWFAKLLSVDSSFRDPQLEWFLRVVDGFKSSEMNFQRLKAIARDADAILEAVTTPQRNRSRTQEAIAGLERFLLFCGDLSELLNTTDVDTAQSAAFDLYRYWFMIRSGALVEVVDDVLTSLSMLGELTDIRGLPERKAMDRLFALAESTRRDLSLAAIYDENVVDSVNLIQEELSLSEESASSELAFHGPRARNDRALRATVTIVAAVASKNAIATRELTVLIASVHGALSSNFERIPEDDTLPAPAVPIRRSITSQYIVCLEDGRRFKSLKRHLRTKYNLSPEAYRAKWGLPDNYPMVASAYAQSLSKLARAAGREFAGQTRASRARRR